MRRRHTPINESADTRPRSFRTICRRYTSRMLVAVGVGVGVLLTAFATWWPLTAAVVAVFFVVASLARPWCIAVRDS
ncbi:MAG: hypothetical protein R8G01_17500 [Ilumatobacteraceae bacterium]|nr:hypothetical protein [Ilumatobacteraceae bacterium]